MCWLKSFRYPKSCESDSPGQLKWIQSQLDWSFKAERAPCFLKCYKQCWKYVTCLSGILIRLFQKIRPVTIVSINTAIKWKKHSWGGETRSMLVTSFEGIICEKAEQWNTSFWYYWIVAVDCLSLCVGEGIVWIRTFLSLVLPGVPA